MKVYFSILTTLVLLYSCKTDFEVNAPYDTVPIVYGLLDQSTDTQFIKINKTFLGVNNTQYAAINDSSLFKTVNARVEQYTNGVLGNVYTLQEKWVGNIDEGLFYTDSQKVYYFVEPNLNPNSTYKLIGEADGKAFSSETSLIGSFSFNNSTQLSLLQGYRFSQGNGTYGTVSAKWSQATNGERYDVSIRFYYEEHSNAGITKKSIDWFVGTLNKNEATSAQYTQPINGELFYQYLATQASLQNTNGVTKRVIREVELRVTAADQTLVTYIDVNKPSNSIITERPEYTNITGGLGIFASRQVLTLADKTLSTFAVEELAEGQYTNAFLFCSDSVDYIGESYHCQ